MIFTSYFGNLRNIPKFIYPISIALKTPTWFKGAEVKILAPTFELLYGYKNGNISKNEYVKIYLRDVLSKLDPVDVIRKLELCLPQEILLELNSHQDRLIISKSVHVVLCCYEKIGIFCHRHIVSKWFRNSGIDVREFTRSIFI